MNIIRKIIIGHNPKDALAYVVDMKAGAGVVTAIEFDEKDFARHGNKCYNIYIKSDDGIMLWKRVENMPVLTEYDCHFD
jgi:hypothetical protein